MIGKTATLLAECGQLINVPQDMKLAAVKDIAAKHTKTLIFTDARNGLLIRHNPHSIGDNVYVRLGLHDIVPSGIILNEFRRAEKGILVVPYAFNSGWRVSNVPSIVFLDLHLNCSSPQFIQAVARAWPQQGPEAHMQPALRYVNCEFD